MILLKSVLFCLLTWICQVFVKQLSKYFLVSWEMVTGVAVGVFVVSLLLLFVILYAKATTDKRKTYLNFFLTLALCCPIAGISVCIHLYLINSQIMDPLVFFFAGFMITKHYWSDEQLRDLATQFLCTQYPDMVVKTQELANIVQSCGHDATVLPSVIEAFVAVKQSEMSTWFYYLFHNYDFYEKLTLQGGVNLIAGAVGVFILNFCVQQLVAFCVSSSWQFGCSVVQSRVKKPETDEVVFGTQIPTLENVQALHKELQQTKEGLSQLEQMVVDSIEKKDDALKLSLQDLIWSEKNVQNDITTLGVVKLNQLVSKLALAIDQQPEVRQETTYNVFTDCRKINFLFLENTGASNLIRGEKVYVNEVADARETLAISLLASSTSSSSSSSFSSSSSKTVKPVSQPQPNVLPNLPNLEAAKSPMQKVEDLVSNFCDWD